MHATRCPSVGNSPCAYRDGREDLGNTTKRKISQNVGALFKNQHFGDLSARVLVPTKKSQRKIVFFFSRKCIARYTGVT